MTEIKVPKYREIVLEFTAVQVQNDVEIYLPYLNYKRDRRSVYRVIEGNYILTDQFGNQWQCSEQYFKKWMRQI